MQDSDWEEEKREEEEKPSWFNAQHEHKIISRLCIFLSRKKRSLGAFLHQNYLQKQKSPRNFFEFGCMCYSNFSSEGVWALTTRLNLVESKLSLVCFFDKKIHVTWVFGKKRWQKVEDTTLYSAQNKDNLPLVFPLKGILGCCKIWT